MIDFLSREKLAGYDPDTLARARVLLVGVGAAGSNAAQNLALIGVGELWLVDPDFAETSNLTRSPLLNVEAAAERCDKVEVAAKALAEISRARGGTVRYASRRVEELGNGAIEAADVVLSLVDSDKTRGYLAVECRLLGKPLIEVGFRGPQTNISVYPNKTSEEPCFLCLNPDSNPSAVSCRLFASELEAQGRTPAIQPAAAVIAGLASEAAVQALHDEFPLGSTQTYFDIRRGRFSKVRLTANPCCSGPHRRLPTPIRIGATADMKLEDLLRSATRILPDPILTLPSPFIVSASCPGCGRQQTIGLPLSRLDHIPSCGRCESNPSTGAEAPLDVYSHASFEERRLSGYSCRDLGLGPGCTVELASLSSEAEAAVQLSGTVADILPHSLRVGSHSQKK